MSEKKDREVRHEITTKNRNYFIGECIRCNLQVNLFFHCAAFERIPQDALYQLVVCMYVGLILFMAVHEP